MEDVEVRLTELEKDVVNIKRAFPKSSIGEIDYMGHREYHEHVIESARQQEKFWMELRGDLARKGAWAVILVVMGLVAHGLLFKLGIYK